MILGQIFIVFLIWFAPWIGCKYLKDPETRNKFVSCLTRGGELEGKEWSKKIKALEAMTGEKTTYNNIPPSLYTIKDGLFFIKQDLSDSFSVMRTEEQKDIDEDFFKSSSVRDYRSSLVSGNGKIMQKKQDTENSVYLLTFRKHLPAYIHASGNSIVMLLGNCPAGSSLEIWLEDSAQLYAENITESRQIIVHARGNSKITIKGSTDNLYISPRGKNVLVDAGELRAKTIVFNASSNDSGLVKIHPLEKYFVLGELEDKSVENKSELIPIKLNSTKYKAKRFFFKSLPKGLSKTVCGVVVFGGYATLFAAIVVSIMHGVFPAAAGITTAMVALAGTSVFYSITSKIRQIKQKFTTNNYIKTSI